MMKSYNNLKVKKRSLELIDCKLFIIYKGEGRQDLCTTANIQFIQLIQLHANYK